MKLITSQTDYKKSKACIRNTECVITFTGDLFKICIQDEVSKMVRCDVIKILFTKALSDRLSVRLSL